MDMFILLTVLQMLSLNEAYNFTCPSQAHWNIRAKSMCEPSRNYTCLFNVTFRVNVYRDRCNRPRILGSGYKYVFQPNLNRATCSVTRYQPFIFDTIGHSDCTYQKSLCNSLGQETYENGNTAVDRKCICNTDRGYSFVKNLQNQCYCNPSTEDCSCYLGINPYNETVVLKDMKCYDDMKMTRRRYLGDRFNISRKIKIVEFDNYRYNVNNVPTTEYRIKAAKFVMIVSFAYFVVWIIVMRIMRQWIGSRIIPRKCDMVESTDCSITIEWFIDVQDKCLSYELYRRPQRTDDVTLRKFSSYDVFEGENGRRMYKLQNLLPETYYEFKLRSVYNDVKSHYSESMTKQTLKLAPRKLDIVECTDCSITIEWFIDVLDKCLSYEVDYRPQGMNDWSTETFLSEDLLKDEDGRRMYTLQNLPPDTYYEFKMRSVYKVAKSHYSESMIMQTLKLVLPEAINHLSEGDKTRYNKLMQTSKKENRYFVRIMIVGKKSAGKTCLLRRLLKESISDVTSTDGVDIVVRRCKINIRDGKWTIGKEIDDDKVGRIKRALTPNAEDRDTQHMQVDETTNINTRHDEMSTNNRYITTDAKVSQDKSEDKNESLSLLMPEDFTTDVRDNLDKNEVTNESSLVMPEDFTSDAKDNLDNNDKKKESSSLVMPEDLMSHVFSRSTVNTPSNLHALCELWDFAGQKEFYATHQAFLTSSAVYLVVADMEDDISKQGFSQCFADFQHVGEYVDFWFDSIHCHRTTDERTSYEHFDPPIILVFTGKDKYDKAEFKKREKELDAQMDKVLGFQSKYHHLHDKLYLSNTKDSDEEFEKLQFAIYETVRKMDNWGNAFPLKWILLEHLIEINKNNGRNFINLNDMFNLAKHPNINILEKEDVLLFLRFQHNVGNIIFFENIPDLIILKPQWLADAFRCLVSDKFDYRRLHHLEDWTLFTRQGKISELLITELFNSKDGSQFSGQTINLHKVMVKLDILVKIENSHYIMPSMMPSAKFEDICETFCIVTEKCKRTSWLCFKFEFLPPSFFNHLSAWFIRQYHPSKIDGGIALYRGICMFDIDASGCVKILVTMSTDTIALQVVSFSEQQRELYSECSNIYSGVIQLIEDVKERYKVKISFKLHFKCSDGDYYKDTFEYDTLTKNQECFCPHHQRHRSEQIYSPWMKTEVFFF
ncbi:uncharacterized protein LOC127710406 [Mytilus californianus]|uniref:uncharacterized protein LOC127710406 n=1 Tax=Mytilus californianus TaxID=6549 RepID=UPI0022464336|nr:uncharacterized protein LOC127710406 [Mytilus californianus]